MKSLKLKGYFVHEDGTLSQKKQSKAQKNLIVKPKKPITAYMYFTKENKSTSREHYKLIAEKWKALPQEER